MRRETCLLVQTNGGLLVNPRLQSEHVNAVALRIGCQVVEHQLPESATAELWAHVHAFDLPAPSSAPSAATSCCAVLADDEERDGIGNQLLHAEAVPALACVQRLEVSSSSPINSLASALAGSSAAIDATAASHT